MIVFKSGNMEYRLEHLADEGRLEIKAYGTWQEEGFDKAAEVFVSQLAETGCKEVLIDYRKFSIPFEAFKIYQRPQMMVNKLQNRYVKIAILSDQITESLKFLETVYINQGMQVNLFTDRKKALEWLK